MLKSFCDDLISCSWTVWKSCQLFPDQQANVVAVPWL
jgi:hypothetical protein